MAYQQACRKVTQLIAAKRATLELQVVRVPAQQGALAKVQSLLGSLDRGAAKANRLTAVCGSKIHSDELDTGIR
eukprot:558041-Karenia_brevis.AAC.1